MVKKGGRSIKPFRNCCRSWGDRRCGWAGTKGVEALVGSQKKKAAEKEKAAELLKTYTVSKEGVSNEGLQFHVGETFKVLERDGNAVLIEKLGDDNNPYFVAAELLNEISDYK